MPNCRLSVRHQSVEEPNCSTSTDKRNNRKTPAGIPLLMSLLLSLPRFLRAQQAQPTPGSTLEDVLEAGDEEAIIPARNLASWNESEGQTFSSYNHQTVGRIVW